VRVLVTGSRTWEDETLIIKVLGEAWAVTPPGEEFVIVHGDCPRGADAVADYVARAMGWEVEPHPADWDRFGKAAGPLRNIEMVKAGADVCLAFIRDGSRGASHCARTAQAAGIPVVRYEC
jgi:YspA, cpYpsA-related SLOG family